MTSKKDWYPYGHISSRFEPQAKLLRRRALLMPHEELVEEYVKAKAELFRQKANAAQREASLRRKLEEGNDD